MHIELTEGIGESGPTFVNESSLTFEMIKMGRIGHNVRKKDEIVVGFVRDKLCFCTWKNGPLLACGQAQ